MSEGALSSATIERDGGHVVIRLPIEDVHALRIALQECPCRAHKSNSTLNIRDRLRRGLARALFPKRAKSCPHQERKTNVL